MTNVTSSPGGSSQPFQLPTTTHNSNENKSNILPIPGSLKRTAQDEEQQWLTDVNCSFSNSSSPSFQFHKVTFSQSDCDTKSYIQNENLNIFAIRLRKPETGKKKHENTEQKKTCVARMVQKGKPWCVLWFQGTDSSRPQLAGIKGRWAGN